MARSDVCLHKFFVKFLCKLSIESPVTGVRCRLLRMIRCSDYFAGVFRTGGFLRLMSHGKFFLGFKPDSSYCPRRRAGDVCLQHFKVDKFYFYQAVLHIVVATVTRNPKKNLTKTKFNQHLTGDTHQENFRRIWECIFHEKFSRLQSLLKTVLRVEFKCLRIMAEVAHANLNCRKSRVKGYVKPSLLLSKADSNQSPANQYSAGLEKKRGRLLKQHTLFCNRDTTTALCSACALPFIQLSILF